MLTRRFVLAVGLAASLPLKPTPVAAAPSLESAIAADLAENFRPDPIGYVPPPRPVFVPTKFAPDARFTSEEINAILACEADCDGLACRRRDDRQAVLDLMRSASEKGYDWRRGRPPCRLMINLFPL